MMRGGNQRGTLYFDVGYSLKAQCTGRAGFEPEAHIWILSQSMLKPIGVVTIAVLSSH